MFDYIPGIIHTLKSSNLRQDTVQPKTTTTPITTPVPGHSIGVALLRWFGSKQVRLQCNTTSSMYSRYVSVSKFYIYTRYTEQSSGVRLNKIELTLQRLARGKLTIKSDYFSNGNYKLVSYYCACLPSDKVQHELHFNVHAYEQKAFPKEEKRMETKETYYYHRHFSFIQVSSVSSCNIHIVYQSTKLATSIAGWRCGKTSQRPHTHACHPYTRHAKKKSIINSLLPIAPKNREKTHLFYT